MASSWEIGLAAVRKMTFRLWRYCPSRLYALGVSGEWFRPFALMVTSSAAVSLFYFTLDPMLSVFWGDPLGHHLCNRKRVSVCS